VVGFFISLKSRGLKPPLF